MQHGNSQSKRCLCHSGELLLLCKNLNLKLTNLDKSSILPNAEAYIPVCTEQSRNLQSDGVTVELFFALCFLKTQATMQKISTKDTAQHFLIHFIHSSALSLAQTGGSSKYRFQQASIHDSVCHFSLNFSVVYNQIYGFLITIMNRV